MFHLYLEVLAYGLIIIGCAALAWGVFNARRAAGKGWRWRDLLTPYAIELIGYLLLWAAVLMHAAALHENRRRSARKSPKAELAAAEPV